MCGCSCSSIDCTPKYVRNQIASSLLPYNILPILPQPEYLNQLATMDSQTTPCFKILMFPWLAHGHIFPYLELSKRILATKNFHNYFCTTPINFSSIKNFIQAHNLDDSIELVELHLEPSPLLPPHYYTTKNLPWNLNSTLQKVFQTAKSSFPAIITTLKPDLVVYDIFHPWAARIASSHGIPAVHFLILGAATRCYVHHQYISRNDDFPFPELCLAQGHQKKSLDDFMVFLYTNVHEGDEDIVFVGIKLSSEVVLIKTSKSLEGKYIDYVSSVCNKKLLPVGPLVTDSSGDENSEILQWLSKKRHHSTVYISFGSEHFLSEEEIEEIAKGLDLCEANFIWVIRFPQGENSIALEETLPKGFLDRVQERGIVVTGWAPQAKILGHPSTGAFISHCGWSSVMESMYCGVPIIGMPMKLNMFIDANMLVKIGAGVRIPLGENEGYKGEDIAKVISEVIVGKSGDGLRRRAQELHEKMRMEEGQYLDVVAEYLWQLCLKNMLKEEDNK